MSIVIVIVSVVAAFIGGILVGRRNTQKVDKAIGTVIAGSSKLGV